MVKEWNNEIGEKLMSKVEMKARDKFNDWLKDGNKLTYTQLRGLNSVWKKDYAK